MLTISQAVNLPPGRSEALDRAFRFMTSRGYTYSATTSPPGFKRGSKTGSLTAISPKSWRAMVTIKVDEETTTIADCTFNIETSGQVVTAVEREFWDCEASELAAALKNEPVGPKSEKIAVQAVRQTLTVLLVSSLLATVVGLFSPVVTLLGAVSVVGATFMVSVVAGLLWLRRQ